MHQLEKGGLAAAAATEQNESLTVRNLQGDARNDATSRNIVNVIRHIAKFDGIPVGKCSFRIHFLLTAANPGATILMHLALPDAEIWRILRAEVASKRRGKTMAALATAIRIRHNLITRLLDARALTAKRFHVA